MGRMYLSAFGIHVGGGAVLLKALLAKIQDKLEVAALDYRFKPEDNGLNNYSVNLIPRNFYSRMNGVNDMARRCSDGDLLFCFNSLPPTIRCAGRVVVYVHAPHLVGLHAGISYNFISRLRFIIEILWFKVGAKYASEFWVQTQSMRRALILKYPNSVVRILPFVDDKLWQALQLESVNYNQERLNQASFFYPADGVGHKNHLTLFQAWELLSTKYGDDCPKLVVTLDPVFFEEISLLAKMLNAVPHIINKGPLTRDEVFIQFQLSSALIFPSRAETLGLPLLEATALQKPILASELDFIRDVCVPVETFDPLSAVSIARAVERHLGVQLSPQKYLSSIAISEKMVEMFKYPSSS